MNKVFQGIHWIRSIASTVTTIKANVIFTLMAKVLFLLFASYVATIMTAQMWDLSFTTRLFIYNVLLFSYWLILDAWFGRRIILTWKQSTMLKRILLVTLSFVISVTLFICWDVIIWTVLFNRGGLTLNWIWAVNIVTPYYVFYGIIVFTVFALISTVSRLADSIALTAKVVDGHTTNDEVDTPGSEQVKKKPDPQLIPAYSIGKTHYISVERIIRIEAKSYYANLVLEDTSHLVRESLDSLSDKLSAKGFHRVHRSHIVNISFLDRVVKRSRTSNLAVLSNGDKVPISRNKYPEFKQSLESMTGEVSM